MEGITRLGFSIEQLIEKLKITKNPAEFINEVGDTTQNHPTFRL